MCAKKTNFTLSFPVTLIVDIFGLKLAQLLVLRVMYPPNKQTECNEALTTVAGVFVCMRAATGDWVQGGDGTLDVRLYVRLSQLLLQRAAGYGRVHCVILCQRHSVASHWTASHTPAAAEVSITATSHRARVHTRHRRLAVHPLHLLHHHSARQGKGSLVSHTHSNTRQYHSISV